MTKEQREAIELAKEFTKMDFSNPMGWTGYYDAELEELSQAIETVLNLIKEQQEKLEKKDKIIDLMAAFIDEISEYYTKIEGKNNDFCDEKCIDKNIDCRDCIKQYFEREK